MTIFQMSCSQWMYSNNYIFTYKKNHLNSRLHSSFSRSLLPSHLPSTIFFTYMDSDNFLLKILIHDDDSCDDFELFATMTIEEEDD